MSPWGIIGLRTGCAGILCCYQMPLHPPREKLGSKAAPDPPPWCMRCCETIRASFLSQSHCTTHKQNSAAASEHPQLCRFQSAWAEEEMYPVIFIRDLLFSFPCQGHFAFTVRAVRALSQLCCNSQESISTMKTVAKTTELSADVQLLQYIALCECR